ncbi:MAG: serine/threonine dehydratase [Rickettsiaceae bacterium]|nr:serine/threonine dehydratase [Rickettsiaceae bacterium]
MDSMIQNKIAVAKAYSRIHPYLHKTPLIYSNNINEMLKSNIYFKIDALQKTGSFKIRGVFNHLLKLKEQSKLPKEIVTYSTGNHGLAIAYAAKFFNIHAKVYLPKNVASIKRQIAKFYGAEVIYVKTRKIAEELCLEEVKSGAYYLPPSDDDLVIAGAGTVCHEAFMQMKERNIAMPDAIFASCGGGGLLSGTYLAKELNSPKSSLIGCEPRKANDAFLSLQNKEIYRFADSPDTIADGLRALSISPRTFAYIKKLDDFYLLGEKTIYYWTARLIQTLKITCEPSAAISMAAAHNWINKYGFGKNILVIISGGNINTEFYNSLLEENLFYNHLLAENNFEES